MDADEIDLSKENIQPLRQGRKTAQLGLALKAQNDKGIQDKMLKERESYELAIITYEGEDPISPRLDYVHWIEQCCPKYGPESNMIPLLEDTIMLYKDDDRYKQDARFIEIVIKYIETQAHAPELFQIVHSQGIGTKCASLYKAWAECLDSTQNFKAADQIYRLGIANNAEPTNVLKDLHAQFQLSVARRMLIEGEVTIPTTTESTVTDRQRKVLGKLGKASAVGSLRFTRKGPGSVNTLRSDSRNNVKINIYQEDDDEILLPEEQNNRISAFASSDVTYKENTTKPHQWNKGFPKKQHRETPLPSMPVIPRTPTFEVLKDDDWNENDEKDDIQQLLPTPVTASKVLKTRKAEVAQKTPMQLFKSPHIGNITKSMPKFEVFTGGREFSFEELRFAYYSRHHKVDNDVNEE